MLIPFFIIYRLFRVSTCFKHPFGHGFRSHSMCPRLEAAQSGHLQISELLIKEGADPKLGIIIIRVFFLILIPMDPNSVTWCFHLGDLWLLLSISYYSTMVMS